MTTLTATIGGTTTTLSDGNPFALIEADLGMAEVRRITDRGPLQHGDSDIDFRLEPTMYPLGLLIYAQSAEEHYTHRQTLLRLFRPSRTPIQLTWLLDNGDTRQIDVHVSGRLTFSSKDASGFTQRCVVPLRAADPTFYDPTPQAATFSVGAGGSFSVPLAVPVSVGSSTVNQTTTVSYTGTWRAYPIVTITGPLTNTVITNQATGDKLDLPVTINASDSRTIDCRPGRKTVVDAAGANQIDELSDDSDLQTFSLEADPEAPGGNNAITVAGSGATSATQIAIVYDIRYIGI